VGDTGVRKLVTVIIDRKRASTSVVVDTITDATKQKLKTLSVE